MAGDAETFELFYQGSTPLSGPVCDGDKLIACSAEGDTLRIDEDGAKLLKHVSGSPQGIALDNDGGMYICDTAYKAITTMTEDGMSTVVDNYEESRLKGPSDAVVDDQGVIFFTDSGDFGETSLSKPEGSVFCISGKERVLTPLLYKCLVHPAGIAVHGADKQQVVYVAEQGRNRILRGVQYPTKGVWNVSVFHQFAGGVGPAGVCVDEDGNVYVARADFGGPAPVGTVSVLSSRGELLADLPCPAHHLTGIAIGSKDSLPYLFVTEQSTRAVYRLHRSNVPV